MIRIDVLVSSPIFLLGLTQVLNEAGIKVVATRTSPDEEPSWLADATLIDTDALNPPHHLTHIAETAKCAAVLVFTTDTDHAAYLGAGASGVINKRETGEYILSLIHI